MLSRSLVARLCALVLFTSFVGAIGLAGYQFWRVRLSDRVLSKIQGLVLHPPPATAELEWAVHVFWTCNLHCNAIPNHYASIAYLKELDRSLDIALTNGPTIHTIDVLWDCYERMSESGARYRARYEPIKDQIAEEVSRDGNEYADSRSYQDFLDSVTATNSRLD